MARKQNKHKWFKIENKGYGSALRGRKIYYEGKKPAGVRRDGSFAFGKNILEILDKQFPTGCKLVLTKTTDTIAKSGRKYEVCLSEKSLKTLNQDKLMRTRDIKIDLLQKKFSSLFPTYFKGTVSVPYVAGNLARILAPGIAKRLSSKDKDALNKFLPEYYKAEAQSAIALKASTQIGSLEDLANDLKSEFDNKRSEGWWQTYIQSKILLIQQGYIRSIEKMNVGVGGTKYPDFALVTHDNYLDILEIKKPDTPVLQYDSSRDNYYLDKEMTKAIIQLENYLENITNYADPLRSFIKDKHNIELKVVKPRGIILAGDARQFTMQKQKDDFRRLSQGLKHISIVTYDELHARLENYISVLREHSHSKNAPRKSKARKKS